jgi:3-isopropylmalate/(R)-2-methylmalate dehydratase large subunit
MRVIMLAIIGQARRRLNIDEADGVSRRHSPRLDARWSAADSHTSSNGGLGALAWGIGASEVEHVLATQTIVQRKPKAMRLWFDGRRGPGVFAKDLILYVIGQLGTAAGRGHTVEYAGPAIAQLSIEERLTICNISIELGARAGLVAPDDQTFDYLAGREFAPRGRQWDEAVASWHALRSDDGARFDMENVFDCARVTPQVTWGTSPQDVIAVDGHPRPGRGGGSGPASIPRAGARLRMGLVPGAPLAGTAIDYAFIGSCRRS